MSAIDIESLLLEISPDAPTGEDLEYDSAYLKMVEDAKGKPRQEMGDSVIEAEEPDWRAVQNEALELARRTIDLRVAIHLVRSSLHTGGWSGLADGLALLAGYLEQHWAQLHPKLDPDDNNDPILRTNTLALLVDRDGMLRSLRETPLVDTRGIGAFSLNSIAIANGEMTASAGTESPDAALIEEAFNKADPQELQGTSEALDRVKAATQRVQDALAAALNTNAPDLAAFQQAVEAAQSTVGERLARLTGGGPTATPEDGTSEAPAPPGAIRSRADVQAAIDRICKYYEENEPSSPVPVLLQRARKLVNTGFLEVIKNLLPSAEDDAEKLKGPSDD